MDRAGDDVSRCDVCRWVIDPAEVAACAQLAAWSVAEIEDGRRPPPGAIRRIHRLLVMLTATTSASSARPCRVCGRPIDQPARGRPRDYCSIDCRRHAEKERRNDRLSA